jgi:hypothetical protein
MRSILIPLTLIVCSYAYGQDAGEQEPSARWPTLKGGFLEPDRFGIVYDKTPSRLRLEAGYGDEFLRLGKSAFGAEVLIWSGLKALTGFRFPVETADYFFGLYSISPLWIGLHEPLQLRVRASHISSHFVDGTSDSVIGGASSRFSREFISAECALNRFLNGHYIVSAGLKYVFHQVNKNEPTLQIPVGIDLNLYQLSLQDCLFLSLSSSAGPSLPTYSAALVYSRQYSVGRGLEVYCEYHAGHSRYGVDGNVNEDGFEIGVRLCEIPFLYYTVSSHE